MASRATKLAERPQKRIDRRVLTALIASTAITLLLIAPYVIRAV
jgi:hypothetical protein